ncbi:MAG: response regulator, partial [Methanoregula sp.]
MISALYVDDEPALLELGKIFLERAGDIRVDTVVSALEALVKIHSVPYDIIISDIVMPRMSGIELLERVRQSGDQLELFRP